MKKVYYAEAIYGKEEIDAVNKVLENNLTLMDGPLVKTFEKQVASVFGKKYGVMVNSGSSANLLALSALKLPKGGEVITPALTFTTVVAPLYQLGLVPHFVDVEPHSFNTSVEKIEKAINENTVALMIPNLLGNLPDWKPIYELAKKHDLKVIEDSCDVIGYTYEGGTTGEYNDIVCTSFYASHIITAAGQGGMVCTNDEELYNQVKLLRGWGRSSARFNESEEIEKRFSTRVDGIDYDSKFIFEECGYNFIPSEIAAAFGIEQLKKLPEFRSNRNWAFNKMRHVFNYNFVDPVAQLPHVQTPWLSFPIVLNQESPFTRREMQIFFEENNIQVRTIFSGNITRQPMLKNREWKGVDYFPNADHVMKNGMLIGAHHGITNDDIQHVHETLNKFLIGRRRG